MNFFLLMTSDGWYLVFIDGDLQVLLWVWSIFRSYLHDYFYLVKKTLPFGHRTSSASYNPCHEVSSPLLSSKYMTFCWKFRCGWTSFIDLWKAEFLWYCPCWCNIFYVRFIGSWSWELQVPRWQVQTKSETYVLILVNVHSLSLPDRLF